jgi:hypothetical protein
MAISSKLQNCKGDQKCESALTMQLPQSCLACLRNPANKNDTSPCLGGGSKPCPGKDYMAIVGCGDDKTCSAAAVAKVPPACMMCMGLPANQQNPSACIDAGPPPPPGVKPCPISGLMASHACNGDKKCESAAMGKLPPRCFLCMIDPKNQKDPTGCIAVSPKPTHTECVSSSDLAAFQAAVHGNQAALSKMSAACLTCAIMGAKQHKRPDMCFAKPKKGACTAVDVAMFKAHTITVNDTGPPKGVSVTCFGCMMPVAGVAVDKCEGEFGAKPASPQCGAKDKSGKKLPDDAACLKCKNAGLALVAPVCGGSSLSGLRPQPTKKPPPPPTPPTPPGQQGKKCGGTDLSADSDPTSLASMKLSCGTMCAGHGLNATWKPILVATMPMACSDGKSTTQEKCLYETDKPKDPTTGKFPLKDPPICQVSHARAPNLRRRCSHSLLSRR